MDAPRRPKVCIATVAPTRYFLTSNLMANVRRDYPDWEVRETTFFNHYLQLKKSLLYFTDSLNYDYIMLIDTHGISKTTCVPNTIRQVADKNALEFIPLPDGKGRMKRLMNFMCGVRGKTMIVTFPEIQRFFTPCYNMFTKVIVPKTNLNVKSNTQNKQISELNVSKNNPKTPTEQVPGPSISGESTKKLNISIEQAPGPSVSEENTKKSNIPIDQVSGPSESEESTKTSNISIEQVPESTVSGESTKKLNIPIEQVSGLNVSKEKPNTLIEQKSVVNLSKESPINKSIPPIKQKSQPNVSKESPVNKANTPVKHKSELSGSKESPANKSNTPIKHKSEQNASKESPMNKSVTPISQKSELNISKESSKNKSSTDTQKSELNVSKKSSKNKSITQKSDLNVSKESPMNKSITSVEHKSELNLSKDSPANKTNTPIKHKSEQNASKESSMNKSVTQKSDLNVSKESPMNKSITSVEHKSELNLSKDSPANKSNTPIKHKSEQNASKESPMNKSVTPISQKSELNISKESSMNKSSTPVIQKSELNVPKKRSKKKSTTPVTQKSDLNISKESPMNKSITPVKHKSELNLSKESPTNKSIITIKEKSELNVSKESSMNKLIIPVKYTPELNVSKESPMNKSNTPVKHKSEPSGSKESPANKSITPIKQKSELNVSKKSSKNKSITPITQKSDLNVSKESPSNKSITTVKHTSELNVSKEKSINKSVTLITQKSELNISKESLTNKPITPVEQKSELNVSNDSSMNKSITPIKQKSVPNVSKESPTNKSITPIKHKSEPIESKESPSNKLVTPIKDKSEQNVSMESPTDKSFSPIKLNVSSPKYESKTINEQASELNISRDSERTLSDTEASQPMPKPIIEVDYLQGIESQIDANQNCQINSRRELYMDYDINEDKPFDMCKATRVIRRQFRECHVRRVVTIPTVCSVSYVTARSVIARYPFPQFELAAIAGYACKCEDGQDLRLIRQGLQFGNPDHVINNGECIHVDKSDPLPLGTNCVIQPNDVSFTRVGDKKNTTFITLNHIPTFGQNVSPAGYFIKENEEIVKNNKLIGPREICLAMTSGVVDVQVYDKPSIGVFSIVSLKDKDNLAEADNMMLYTIFRVREFDCTLHGVIPEMRRDILNRLCKSFTNADIVVVSQSVFLTDKNILLNILEDDFNGVVQFNRLDISNGKRTAFVTCSYDEKPRFVFTLPAYMHAITVTAEILIVPTLKYWMGRDNHGLMRLNVWVDEDITLTKRPQYVRAKLQYSDAHECPKAIIRDPRMRSLFTDTSRDNLILELPRADGHRDTLKSGSIVAALLLK